tara:strand:- start:37 stop:336 length:300 start_codon:yes stop_codon:yes gene_type:complete
MEVLVMDRLNVLFFSFYREDLDVQAAIAPIARAKIYRVMGTIHIECLDEIHLAQVIPIIKYLIMPIGLLRLGRNIVVHCPDFPSFYYLVKVQKTKNLHV